jgi:homocysteine S-methyltransferase
MNPFEKAIASGSPVILDGGLATELERRGYDIGTKLWSAKLLQSHPEAIIDVNRAFLEAGAQCVTSASYQASREGFLTLGLSADEADALILHSVNLAKTARRQHLDAYPETQPRPFVAASIGPWGAMQSDGSEYTGCYAVDETALSDFHRRRLVLLDQSGADVLACETIPNLLEAQVLCALLRSVDTPAWVSFCCRDEHHISDGTPLREAAGLFRDHPRVLALGINCCAPHLLPALIPEIIAAAPGKAIIVYPNSGETYEVGNNSWSGSARLDECADDAVRWSEAGATLIGGCCRTGPEHIAAMRLPLLPG